MDIIFKNVEHRYQAQTPFEKRALYDIDLEIKTGSYVAVIGHTGSGKSTLLQHLNGLLQPTKGSVTIGDRTIVGGKKEKNLKPLRKKVGIVFQFPEHQLFEETVEKDICFGPINFGVSEEEAKRKAKECLSLVGLPEEVLTKSPFELSGGQMRRVAIAGVLAMEPEVLVLDEPTAGLDPRGRKEIMDMFARLHQQKQLTIVLVTHSMEDAARYADEIVIMNKGTIVKKGTPEEIFSDVTSLMELGLDVPETVLFKHLLESKIGEAIPSTCLTIEETLQGLQTLFARVKKK
ncbi:energy-coupling factor transport system ATP-binding protein [Thermolongibacillus altinsuensis]|jgi:energy-coupling factor transport system ATP-binding protein|uniref:Energy-coupling factor transporter ATP-binding protein EcfA2 n=1 Tax=Thermolongibacillus altinsuensis TaxID=575256 RepID=A0A4R1QBB6_9BACL|nr:energy-coupling factor ABC transporter ATP-binding protein [Thermolongibacillus altinsuensis]TCL46265.1 energy-coupling factor transport system ATP-binding protein [Thermolongibacillus altinsuensis]GMB10030.1 energy-coupling factor transporter ATP-binding protein EcfA2 [Thermolongibacillus altinsuensis]